MTPGEKIIAYYRNAASGTSERVLIDPIDFADGQTNDPSDWSLTPFEGLLQIQAITSNGCRVGFAIQNAAGKYVVPRSQNGFCDERHMNDDGTFSAADLNLNTPRASTRGPGC